MVCRSHFISHFLLSTSKMKGKPRGSKRRNVSRTVSFSEPCTKTSGMNPIGFYVSQSTICLTGNLCFFYVGRYPPLPIPLTRTLPNGQWFGFVEDNFSRSLTCMHAQSGRATKDTAWFPEHCKSTVRPWVCWQNTLLLPPTKNEQTQKGKEPKTGK